MESQLQCKKCLHRLAEVANFCPGCGEDLRGLTPLSDTLSGALVGKVIDGRYRLSEKLGEGGMGTVYRVEHVRMGKVLALKVLRPDLAIEKKIKALFQQEAKLVSKLGHPNTIQVFDFGELEDGSLYIAMEFLPGRDLAWMLRAHGPFSEERAIGIGMQLLASLSEAHELGIIHRDIKPANAMLQRRRDGGDWIKVLDFGIAKLVEGEGRKHITGLDFVGTPAYMSPEQGKGEALDPRSDLYSVGALLFELVTGQAVFTGTSPMAILTQHQSQQPPWMTQVAPDRLVSPAFEQVVRKALAKNPGDRYADADQMRAALERVNRDVSGPTTGYASPGVATGQVASREDFDRYERGLRARRVVAPLLAVCALAAALLGGWHLLGQQPSQGPRLSTVEREPNDDPQLATHIPFGEQVQGMIGAAPSGTQSDLDVYRVEVPEAMAVTVVLSGAVDMNLVLEAFEAEPEGRLRHLLVADDGKVGEGERVDGLRVRKGPLYLRVQERRHQSEMARPPRQTTHHPYHLAVERTLDDDGRLEHEPANDRLETAIASPLDRAIRAFTGVPSSLAEGAYEQPLSAVDILLAPPQQGKVHALVVPPEQGTLSVVDAHRVVAWRRQAPAARGAPSAQHARGEPLLVALEAGERGHAVWVLPGMPPQNTGLPPAELMERIAKPGSPYFVAFLSDQPGGTDGILDLLTVLEERGQERHRLRILELVRQALRGSPGLQAFDAAVAGRLVSHPLP